VALSSKRWSLAVGPVGEDADQEVAGPPDHFVPGTIPVGALHSSGAEALLLQAVDVYLEGLIVNLVAIRDPCAATVPGNGWRPWIEIRSDDGETLTSSSQQGSLTAARMGCRRVESQVSVLPVTPSDDAFRAFSFWVTPRPLGAISLEFGWPTSPLRSHVSVSSNALTDAVDRCRRARLRAN
jgi:hypothetical protein